LENDVLTLLEELEELVDRAPKIPMTGKVWLDDSVILDLVDRIRAALPEEIEHAKWLLNERKRILEEAEAEANSIVNRGKSYADKMAEENEVVKQAQAYAEEMVGQAKTYAREVKSGAMQYADGLLLQVEKNLVETLQSIRANREELKGVSRNEGKVAAANENIKD